MPAGNRPYLRIELEQSDRVDGAVVVKNDRVFFVDPNSDTEVEITNTVSEVHIHDAVGGLRRVDVQTLNAKVIMQQPEQTTEEVPS